MTSCPFELLTLIALLYFKEQGVDLVLLEVGIGGLLDTTNVVTGEDCSYCFDWARSSGDLGR